MSRTMRLVLAVFLISASVAFAQADEIQDATIAAPEAHSVVLENEHVRVISAIASAGHKSPLHSHPPLVVISMGTARAKLTNADGTGGIVNVRPGTVFWSNGGAHKWELLAGGIDMIGVEVKAAQVGGAASAGDDSEGAAESAGDIQDSTIADPGAHSVVMENEHVRVISALASAGYKSPMHSHPPILVVQMDTGRLNLKNADGSEALINVRPGSVFWLDGAVHEWEILGGKLNAIAVEIKAAK